MNFNFVEGFKESAWRFAFSGAAVLATAIIGGLFVGSVLNLFAKFIFRKMLPASLLRFVRIGGGLTSGFLAGMFIFSGGGGLGWGGTGNNSLSNQPAASLNSQPSATVVAPSLRVTLLGGTRVVNGGFYLLDTEKEPRTLASVQTLLTDLKSKSAAPAKIELRIYEDSVARSHPAVTELEHWATSHGYAVSVETNTGTLPPTTS